MSADVNECERNLDNCARVRIYYFILRRIANCINTVGGFQCRCFKGLEGDGVTCSGRLWIGHFHFFTVHALVISCPGGHTITLKC